MLQLKGQAKRPHVAQGLGVQPRPNRRDLPRLQRGRVHEGCWHRPGPVAGGEVRASSGNEGFQGLRKQAPLLVDDYERDGTVRKLRIPSPWPGLLSQLRLRGFWQDRTKHRQIVNVASLLSGGPLNKVSLTSPTPHST